MSTFYQTKEMGCIDTLVSKVTETMSTQKPSVNPNLLGFFAEIFSAYPQEKSRVLNQSTSTATKAFFVEALFEANLRDEAQTYADGNGLSQVVKNVQEHKLVPLNDIKPEGVPADNDILIGAYMASGNTEHTKKILENFSSADDGMVRDSLRLSMMQGKFGPTLASPYREQTIVLAACEKYDCKNNMHNMMRVMTLSSAYWSLQSLSQQDAAIKKIFADFFENDSRLKKLLLEETTGFSNYLTTLAVYTAVQDKPNINNSLSIYEKLGPVQEATFALMDKK